MINAILGKKLGMTQIFDERGVVIPVTVILAGPCRVTKILTKNEKGKGYEAVQIGFEETSRLKKPQRGEQKENIRIVEHGKYNKQIGLKFLREFKTSDITAHTIGDTITADNIFVAGEMVDVTGTSKGKGFAGVMKRHNFHGGPRTHGQSDRERTPGSIGPGTTPGRVVKGSVWLVIWVTSG